MEEDDECASEKLNMSKTFCFKRADGSILVVYMAQANTNQYLEGDITPLYLVVLDLDGKDFAVRRHRYTKIEKFVTRDTECRVINDCLVIHFPGIKSANQDDLALQNYNMPEYLLLNQKLEILDRLEAKGVNFRVGENYCFSKNLVMVETNAGNLHIILQSWEVRQKKKKFKLVSKKILKNSKFLTFCVNSKGLCLVTEKGQDVESSQQKSRELGLKTGKVYKHFKLYSYSLDFGSGMVVDLGWMDTDSLYWESGITTELVLVAGGKDKLFGGDYVS